VDRLLTSGGAATAELGIRRLRRLAAQGVAVIAAGGIRAHNVGAIVAATGVREVHAAVGRLTGERAPAGLAQAVRRLKQAANGLRAAPAGRW
jgi:copper homeostasis protein